MNDVTVVTSVTYSSPESLALVADVQYHEPYLSAALNRKFRGIVDPGFYAGFLPKPGGGMNLLITSVDGDKTAGAASVDIGEFYQVTIQHRKDISLALNAGKKYAIVLKGRYLLGEDTYQVNTASHIHAAEFVARTYTDSYQLGDGELLVCTVNIPAGVSTITQEMIDTSERINRTIGIDISDSVTSTRSDVAASSLAVKKAYDLAKSKYTAQDASTTQKGLVQLSSATNSESETEAATPKAVKALHDMLTSKYTGQDATTGRKGIVQLSSATNSNSETLAATPKAVKAAYDLANSKASAAHTHRWAQITDAPVFSSVARVIMGKQSIKDILDYFGLGEGSTLPVGVPVPWPSSRPPEGWLQCNGAAFTRTKYPKLAVAYPDLRLPDLRGEFIRGWDDLRMIDRGRLLLSTQEATYICTAIQAYHGVAGGADIQAGISFASHDNDIINITPDQPRTGNGILYGTKPVDRWAIARAGKLVSNEKDRWIAIRPRNIAFNYIVRAV
ncbi:phage tail protein [Escherichia coli]